MTYGLGVAFAMSFATLLVTRSTALSCDRRVRLSTLPMRVSPLDSQADISGAWHTDMHRLCRMGNVCFGMNALGTCVTIGWQTVGSP